MVFAIMVKRIDLSLNKVSSTYIPTLRFVSGFNIIPLNPLIVSCGS